MILKCNYEHVIDKAPKFMCMVDARNIHQG